jgi:hypothetical protein
MSTRTRIRHPKIRVSNFGSILHQKTLKIKYFIVCVEDYHKLIQSQFLIQSPPPPPPPPPFGSLTDVRVDKNVACLSSLLSYYNRTDIKKSITLINSPNHAIEWIYWQCHWNSLWLTCNKLGSYPKIQYNWNLNGKKISMQFAIHCFSPECQSVSCTC